MIKKKWRKTRGVEIQREVDETLFAQCDCAGVVVKLKDSKVEEVFLTWANGTGLSYTRWREFPLPGGVAWLKNLHTAIGKMLNYLKEEHT